MRLEERDSDTCSCSKRERTISSVSNCCSMRATLASSSEERLMTWLILVNTPFPTIPSPSGLSTEFPADAFFELFVACFTFSLIPFAFVDFSISGFTNSVWFLWEWKPKISESRFLCEFWFLSKCELRCCKSEVWLLSEAYFSSSYLSRSLNSTLSEIELRAEFFFVIAEFIY